MMTSTNFIIRLSLTGFVCLFVLSGTLFAESSISKTFEFGPGLQYPSSNSRTFYVPCGLDVRATVVRQRGGESGTQNDIPIVIELHSPGASVNEEGPLVAQQQTVAERWFGVGVMPFSILNGEKSSRGCNLPWKVRVRTQSGTTPPTVVFGQIIVSFDDFYYLSTGSPFSLASGATRTINIGPDSGLTQGRLTIPGTWGHYLGFMPIRMRFQLIDPDGNIVASETAYSLSEANLCCTNDVMRLYHQVTSCQTGQWKLRIKNVSDYDAADVRIKDFPAEKRAFIFTGCTAANLSAQIPFYRLQNTEIAGLESENSECRTITKMTNENYLNDITDDSE